MSGIAGKYAKLALYAPGPIAKRKRRERDDAVQKTRQENWVKKFIAGGGDFMKAAAEYRKHLEEVRKTRQQAYRTWKKKAHEKQLEERKRRRQARKQGYPVPHADVPKPSRPPARTHYRKGMSSADFYRSWEWNTLRYQTLKRFGAICMHCGAPGNHVDHIKPRSRYPHLELDPDNLQILCEPCNVGKSNLYEDDWRKDGPSSSPA